MKSFFQAMLLCSANVFAPETSLVSPTQNLIAYFDTLLETQTIGDVELSDLIDSIKAGSPLCPITLLDAQRSSAKNIARETINALLDQNSIEITELAKWAHNKRQEQEKEHKRRGKTREETHSLANRNYQDRLSAGYEYTCVIDVEGNPVCWGNNEEKQITGKPKNLGKVQSISAGKYHVCVIKLNNEVECWGYKGSHHGLVKPFDLGPALGVSAGMDHTCAIKLNGCVECWGRKGDIRPIRQELNTTDNCEINLNISADLGPVLAISAGGFHTCAILLDRSVECWGNDQSAQVSGRPKNLGPVLAISSGHEHTCAIRKIDRNVECWGEDEDGQANGGKPKDLGPVLAISAGGYHTCAIKVDGKIVCWGSDNYGQSTPPNGLNVERWPEGQDDQTKIPAISARGYHTCGITLGRRIGCWGRNEHGQSTPPERLMVMTRGGGE